jgi:hypothetical protein
MKIETNEYYEEFLRYDQMAKTQQEECNLGVVPYLESSVDDDLMKNVHLYDVVNRKYAGFTQILHDLWHNTQESHPYKHKLHNIRKPIIQSFSGVHNSWTMHEWLYVFLIHRLTGSGINYAKNPSGYSNTILPDFHWCDNIELMKTHVIRRAQNGPSFYTSVGYQFPAFPKPNGIYKTGGNMFIVEILPKLVNELVDFLISGEKKYLREVGNFMFEWNKKNGLRAYKFQYAAFIADLADFYPELVRVDSLFYYGTNAKECIKYMAKPLTKMKEDDFLDEVINKACYDTAGNPYDIEDVMCDAIRWIENYARPGGDYDHLDRDKIFSSCNIKNHPFGRQKRMLELGLISSFNNINVHPSDDYVLKMNKMSISEYKAIA